MQLQEGILFDNRYLLKKLLGRGGFSEVWLAEDALVDLEKVAIKVYAPGIGLDDDGTLIFKNEFKLVRRLNHPNLLHSTYFGICDHSPYLVMDFCDHGSTQKLVGNMTEEQVWHFLSDVATGLAYLHEQEPSIIHQDIKPDNVLIDYQEHYLITDFGISTKARSTLRKSMSKAEASSGTIAYMSPERFGRENEPVKASDIWALGATVFELITGDAPFGDHGGLVQKSGAEIPYIKGSWSKELLSIVNDCLQNNPLERPTADKLIKWAKNHANGENLIVEEKKEINKQCIKCGKKIPPQRKFCIYCGSNQEVIRCRSCCTEIDISAKFCPYCRTKNNP